MANGAENRVRDRELKRIADATEDLAKQMKVLNQNFVLLGRNIAPAMVAVQAVFDNLLEEPEMISTGTAAGLGQETIEFAKKETPDGA